jgi:excisionase family DNA binding protein
MKPAEGNGRTNKIGYKSERTTHVNLRTVMTVPEMAEFLHISESLIRRLIRERRIPFLQIDGRYLFYCPVVEEWLRTISIIPNGESASEIAQRAAEEMWNTKEVK